MATSWWKILVLQILMCTIINSTAIEFGDNSKLSNENKILLFNQLLENINNQHATEGMNDKVEQMKNLYHQSLWTTLNSKQNYGKFTENDIKNDDLPPFEDYQNDIGIENLNEQSLQRGKKHYVTTLCRFKICNGKKSMDNYDRVIRYVTKRYNPNLD